MGYQGRVFDMRFEQMPGAEVRVKSCSLGKALNLMKLVGGEPTDEDMKELVGEFAKRVKAWNLADDDDEPLPMTLETLMEWDFGEAMLMAQSWLEQSTTVGPTAGSGKPKPNTQLEMTIPMDPASGM